MAVPSEPEDPVALSCPDLPGWLPADERSVLGSGLGLNPTVHIKEDPAPGLSPGHHGIPHLEMPDPPLNTGRGPS